MAPGQPVQIRIEAKEGEDFKGFIVQARDDTGPDIQVSYKQNSVHTKSFL